MELSTSTQTGSRRLSMDELLQEMENPRQQFDNPGSDFAPPPPQIPMPGDPIRAAENAEIKTDETFRAAGESFASMACSGTAGLCSFIGDEKASKYRIPAAQEGDLAKSYTKVARHYNMASTNPVFEAALLTLVILGPSFKDAFSDKRIKALEKEQKEAEVRQRNFQIELEQQRIRIAEMEKIQTDGNLQKV
ncbi:hypothetical protein JZU46_01080 [bacterium]|jgi:hypothetical protein|nr:hypothetical protein [bacterium]